MLSSLAEYWHQYSTVSISSYLWCWKLTSTEKKSSQSTLLLPKMFIFSCLQIASYILMWHSCGGFHMVLFLKSNEEYEWDASAYNISIIPSWWRNQLPNAKITLYIQNQSYDVSVQYYSIAICKTRMEITNLVVFWTHSTSDSLYRREDFCRSLRYSQKFILYSKKFPTGLLVLWSIQHNRYFTVQANLTFTRRWLFWPLSSYPLS